MAATRRQRYWVFALLGCLVIVLIVWAVFHKQPKKPAPPPAIPVTAVRAAAHDLPISVTALGAAQAWTSDTIFAQVSGKLLRVNFAEGSVVHAGQVLAEVDPAPYKAVLEEAEGTLRRDQATLVGAQRDLTRFQHLQQMDSIARQTVEDEAATVAQDQGTVQLDKGTVDAARVNLRWCTIVSPVTGRAGVRLVDPGNLVSASGSTASTPATAAATSSASATGSSGSGIVVINQIQPIAVTFTVPEGDFQRIQTLSDGFRKPLAVQAYSQEDARLLDSGQLSIADNKVDPATGTVELKARFANAGKTLWPGQFVDVKLATQTIANATLIPTNAVNRGPKGTYVFVIGPGNKAVMQPIVTEGTEGALTAVKSGVKPGDAVITDGQMTLKAGSPVRAIKAAPQQAGA
jgi:multidrug efflux system membrane fusion protein